MRRKKRSWPTTEASEGNFDMCSYRKFGEPTCAEGPRKMKSPSTISRDPLHKRKCSARPPHQGCSAPTTGMRCSAPYPGAVHPNTQREER